MTFDLYSIVSRSDFDGGAEFAVRLNPGCEVFRGHFPDYPILPGVCSVQIVRECAEAYAGRKLAIRRVRLCRFTSPIRPDEVTDLQVRLTLDAAGLLSGSIASGEVQYVSLSAEMS